MWGRKKSQRKNKPVSPYVGQPYGNYGITDELIVYVGITERPPHQFNLHLTYRGLEGEIERTLLPLQHDVYTGPFGSPSFMHPDDTRTLFEELESASKRLVKYEETEPTKDPDGESGSNT